MIGSPNLLDVFNYCLVPAFPLGTILCARTWLAFFLRWLTGRPAAWTPLLAGANAVPPYSSGPTPGPPLRTWEGTRLGSWRW